MSLKEQITEDMKTAMRAKDAERLGTIRLLLAAMKQKEVDERVELDDAAVVAIVDKLVKQRKDSIAAFTQAGRTGPGRQGSRRNQGAARPTCPQRLSADEVAAEVKAIVAELGAKGPGDMGKVMGAVKARLAGKADMGQVSRGRQGGAGRLSSRWSFGAGRASPGVQADVQLRRSIAACASGRAARDRSAAGHLHPVDQHRARPSWRRSCRRRRRPPGCP